jgi:ornithine carbamoyltransferase
MKKKTKRDLTSISDLKREEVDEIFEIARDLKKRLKRREYPPFLEKRVLVMIFEKPSLRTRVTFETGMYQLGGHAIDLAPSDIGLGKRESIGDVARNLERWVDIIMARTFSQKTVLELAQHACVPVINGLSDLEHPCQALTDFFTLTEKRGDLHGFKLAFIGDGNNICHSLILLSALVGVKIQIASPKGFEPKKEIVKMARTLASPDESRIEICSDPYEAVKDADAIYTDIWASMGQEEESEERRKVFSHYQVNAELLSHARKDVLIMHDLPAHRGEEITDEVIDSDRSIVFDQAENRLHAQKGILVFLSQKSQRTG